VADRISICHKLYFVDLGAETGDILVAIGGDGRVATVAMWWQKDNLWRIEILFATNFISWT
jgi:hypothetical protein